MGITETSSTVVINPGIEIKDYRMVSFVHFPNTPSSLSLFREAMGGAYNRDNFRIGTYDPVSRKYVECSKEMMIEPGKSYWFLARNGLNITVTGVPVSVNHEIDVKLEPGWNMIASPNNKSYNWNKVQVFQYNDDGTIKSEPIAISSSDNHLIQKRLWEWRDGTYFYYDTDGLYDNEEYEADLNLRMMTPNGGYWIKANDTNVVLRFPAEESLLVKSEAGSQKIVAGSQKSKVNIITPAFADSEDSPPRPMENLSVSSSGADAGGSCFIDTSASGESSNRSSDISLIFILFSFSLIGVAGVIADFYLK